jgi:hypothetical protein
MLLGGEGSRGQQQGRLDPPGPQSTLPATVMFMSPICALRASTV